MKEGSHKLVYTLRTRISSRGKKVCTRFNYVRATVRRTEGHRFEPYRHQFFVEIRTRCSKFLRPVLKCHKKCYKTKYVYFSCGDTCLSHWALATRTYLLHRVWISAIRTCDLPLSRWMLFQLSHGTCYSNFHLQSWSPALILPLPFLHSFCCCGFVVLVWNQNYWVLKHSVWSKSKIIAYFIKNDTFCNFLREFCEHLDNKFFLSKLKKTKTKSTDYALLNLRIFNRNAESTSQLVVAYFSSRGYPTHALSKGPHTFVIEKCLHTNKYIYIRWGDTFEWYWTSLNSLNS